MRYVALRYFNVAGSDPMGRIGQATAKATLLTKVACEVVVGKRDHVSIYGTDYPTPDGTGVRDYIHVEDLADAHLKALAYLRGGGESTTLNCGYGRGYSVRELLNMVETVAGHPIPKREAPRRAGDPPTLVARASRIRSLLGWQPRHDDLKDSSRPRSRGNASSRRDNGVALGELRPMKMRRPRTLLGLVLLGLAFVTLPLLIAIGNAVLKLGQLATESEAVLGDSATATLQNEKLVSLLSGMERNARQYLQFKASSPRRRSC